MDFKFEPFTSIAPGRLCLFGEHQDYLGLPVVALALPLYCRIHVQPDHKRRLELRIIASPPSFANKDNDDDDQTITETMIFDLDHLPPRQTLDSASTNAAAAAEPNFALAALHEAVDSGWEFCQGGAICTSTCDFVMKAGLSSSSAFCVAWIQVLARLAGKELLLSPLELAQRAHQAEVTHFGAPGGTMDHVTSALGGLLRIGPDPWQVQKLVVSSEERKDKFGVWVLAYSGEEKDTLGHLRRCKTARLKLLDKLRGSWDTADVESSDRLTADEQVLLEATRTNRDTEREAVALWTNPSAHTETIGRQLGALMMQHHESLRDGLKLSTDRLEELNKAAVQAGAWGFKVVGSGGGGCGVAWTSSELAPKVSQAMKQAGAPITWIIDEPSMGARILSAC